AVGELRSAGERLQTPTQVGGDLVETLALPRHQDQPEMRVIDAGAAENTQGDLLFRRLGAPGDPNQIVRAEVEQTAELLRSRVVALGLHAVVLHVAGDYHQTGRGSGAAEVV